jgi:hypothetical protein
MKYIKYLILSTFLFNAVVLFSQLEKIKMLPGRIAFSSDGNLHDSDDWGATAMSLAIIHYAGLEKRFVHYDYNNHLGKSRKSWEAIMDDAAKGGARRFNLDVNRVFNDQEEKDKAIENFKKEAEKSSSKDPLWLICGGPMQMPYEMINVVSLEKRQFIRAISHGKWNEDHHHSDCIKTWADMKADFPEVVYHEILDQNNSNGEFDFHTHMSHWTWLKESENENWQWLFDIDDTWQVDSLESWKSDTKEAYDVSDAGMVYWLITGGPKDGNERAGWREIKALFTNQPREINFDSEDYVLLEAESTTSPLGEWKVISLGDENYVENASGWKFIEFQGNEGDKGEPHSPLKYNFIAPKSGNYRLLMMTSKRLEGARGDWCNDGFVKMDGDFTSETNLTKEELEDYIKYFQEGSTKTPELSWHWGFRGEKGRHVFHNLVYGLKEGKEYTLTLAGRSQRFSVDYLILYNVEKMSLQEAMEIFSVQ